MVTEMWVMMKKMLRKKRNMTSTLNYSKVKKMEVMGKRRNLTSIETN